MPAPLDGLRVLDIGTLFPSGLCSAMLGDLGADVIKLEPPGGDSLRSMGAKLDGRSLTWAVVGRNKRSITLDLNQPRAQELLSRLVERADLVVVISEHTAREVQHRLGVPADRVVLCRPGAPPASNAPPADGRGPILFVGTIEPRKNLPTLFAAYEDLVARNPGAPPLVLAGGTVEQSGEILDGLRARAAIAGRVEYRGYVSSAEREALYASASMLVLPSFHEGFGMPAVEAMQAGVPVIASTGGALPEVVGTAGITVDPADAAGFSAAMERLLADPAERQRRIEAGRQQARLFSWPASAATLLEAYRETFARRAARR